MITTSFRDDCLPLADDFRQYYLGAFARTSTEDQESVSGTAEPIEGYEGTLGGPVVEGDNPLDEAGVFQPTSEVLPPDEFPQFTSQGAAEYPLEEDSPFGPIEGERAGLPGGAVARVQLRTFPAGWQDVAVDLSGFAGKQVEVSISYVTDPASGGVGAFVDDTRFLIDGVETLQDGLEGAESTWTVGGPPEDSPPNSRNWEIGGQLVNFYAGTSTEDAPLLGFGLEQLATDEERADLVGRALDGLLN